MLALRIGMRCCNGGARGDLTNRCAPPGRLAAPAWRGGGLVLDQLTWRRRRRRSRWQGHRGCPSTCCRLLTCPCGRSGQAGRGIRKGGMRLSSQPCASRGPRRRRPSGERLHIWSCRTTCNGRLPINRSFVSGLPVDAFAVDEGRRPGAVGAGVAGLGAAEAVRAGITLQCAGQGGARWAR